MFLIPASPREESRLAACRRTRADGEVAIPTGRVTTPGSARALGGNRAAIGLSGRYHTRRLTELRTPEMIRAFSAKRRYRPDSSSILLNIDFNSKYRLMC
jgi:hypothetical protein